MSWSDLVQIRGKKVFFGFNLFLALTLDLDFVHLYVLYAEKLGIVLQMFLVVYFWQIGYFGTTVNIITPSGKVAIIGITGLVFRVKWNDQNRKEVPLRFHSILEVLANKGFIYR